MIKNALAVRDSTAPLASQIWSNPSTGAMGFAQVRSQFTTSDGTLCKKLHVSNKAKQIEGEAAYTVCNYRDRGWTLSSARPAR